MKVTSVLIKQSAIGLAIFCFLLLINAETVLGQDNQHSWLASQLIYKLDDKWSFAAIPIERVELTEPSHIDVSLDLAVRRKFKKGVSFQLLGRHFLRPNDLPDRTFMFTDVAHQFKWRKLTIRNALRLHLAFDIQINDADFLRYIPRISYPIGTAHTLFVGNDWFFQLNGVNAMRRVRYQIGWKFVCDNRTSLTAQYWREESVGLDPSIKTNMFVLTLTHLLNR